MEGGPYSRWRSICTQGLEPITENAEGIRGGRVSEEARGPSSLEGEQDLEEGGQGFSLPLQKPLAEGKEGCKDQV